MEIIAIGGSLRAYSTTYQLLKAVVDKAAKYPEVHIQLIDLRQMHLPFCTGEAEYPAYPDVKILNQKIKNADAILLATPEYHGSISGVLKNTLDLVEDNCLNKKLVGLLAVLGGSSSTNAINTLRIICRQFHCWVLPDQIIVSHANKSFNEQGNLIDMQLENRLDLFLESFITAAKKFPLQVNDS